MEEEEEWGRESGEGREGKGGRGMGWRRREGGGGSCDEAEENALIDTNHKLLHVL